MQEGQKSRWEDRENELRQEWERENPDKPWGQVSRGYRYGYERASDPRYQNRDWDASESDLQRAWNEWDEGMNSGEGRTDNALSGGSTGTISNSTGYTASSGPVGAIGGPRGSMGSGGSTGMGSLTSGPGVGSTTRTASTGESGIGSSARMDTDAAGVAGTSGALGAVGAGGMSDDLSEGAGTGNMGGESGPVGTDRGVVTSSGSGGSYSGASGMGGDGGAMESGESQSGQGVGGQVASLWEDLKDSIRKGWDRGRRDTKDQ